MNNIDKGNHTEKSCKNCDYYLQHYIVNKFAIRKTLFGHCTKVINKKTTLCKSWTERKEDKSDKESDLKKILQKISSQLEKIALVVNMDSFK